MESCCFTGHRHLPTGEGYLRLRQMTEEAVREAASQGCRRFYAGGALGFDMLAAAIVCQLRDTELPDISLHLLLPCRGQEARWSTRDRERYAAMLSLSDSYHYLAEEYAEGVMAARNRALVASADCCIAYMQNPASGTGGTVSMARRRGIPVRNLAEE
ncbi:MAG: DUF1273 family protein [Clostridia bacterium]|nr:DUF1273 family protein [Clostridia bacterium]